MYTSKVYDIDHEIKIVGSWADHNDSLDWSYSGYIFKYQLRTVKNKDIQKMVLSNICFLLNSIFYTTWDKKKFRVFTFLYVCFAFNYVF